MSKHNPVTYKLWYDKNKEKKIIYGKKYYQDNREVIIKNAKKRRELNPFFWRNSHRKRVYGITNQDVDFMIEKQNNKCAICLIEFHPIEKNKKMSIDHNHKTKKVRGLLCNKCNISIGHIEKEGFLEKALIYLQKHNV